jgi:hypothetical protein
VRTATTRPYVVLGPEDHVVLGEADFGMPGLTAVEAIGPFVDIRASGPRSWSGRARRCGSMATSGCLLVPPWSPAPR